MSQHDDRRREGEASSPPEIDEVLTGSWNLQLSEYVDGFLRLNPSSYADVHNFAKRFGMLETRQMLTRMTELSKQALAKGPPKNTADFSDTDARSDEVWTDSLSEAISRRDEDFPRRRLLQAKSLEEEHVRLTWFVEEWSRRTSAGEPLDDLVDAMNRSLSGVCPLVSADAAGRLTWSWHPRLQLAVRGADLAARAWGELLELNARTVELTPIAQPISAKAGVEAARSERKANDDLLWRAIERDRERRDTLKVLAARYEKSISAISEGLKRRRGK